MTNNLTEHAIEYRHGGKTYLLKVMASDFDDAEARIRSAHFNGVPLRKVWGV